MLFTQQAAKSLARRGGFGINIKRGDWPYREGLSIEEGSKLLHTTYFSENITITTSVTVNLITFIATLFLLQPCAACDNRTLLLYM